MSNENRVVIVDGDPFSCGWSMMLLARDWRSWVVKQLSSLAEITTAQKDSSLNPSLFLIETSLLEKASAERWWDKLAHLKKTPRILLYGTAVCADITKNLPFNGFSGWLLKGEIGDSLGWAVDSASTSRWVLTPSTEDALSYSCPNVPLTILDGRHPPALMNLTSDEAAFARLAYVCSMERQELAEERFMRSSWANGKVHGIYDKLGLHELLRHEEEAISQLGPEFTKHPRFVELRDLEIAHVKRGKKTRDMESLAFHVITQPDARIIR